MQREILKRLSLSKGLRFSGLNLEHYESEHMNYHLQKLIDQGLVIKKSEYYALTNLGKDFVGNLDDDFKTTEKQPKVSVLVRTTRNNPTTGQREQLVLRRLNNPYYGKIGRIAGKVRFGETFEEAAKRELFEETGLVAEALTLVEIYHKIRKEKDGSAVQDVLFISFECEKFSGDFIDKTEVQDNLWISYEEYRTNKELDFFDDFEYEPRRQGDGVKFLETSGIHDGY